MLVGQRNQKWPLHAEPVCLVSRYSQPSEGLMDPLWHRDFFFQIQRWTWFLMERAGRLLKTVAPESKLVCCMSSGRKLVGRESSSCSFISTKSRTSHLCGGQGTLGPNSTDRDSRPQFPIERNMTQAQPSHCCPGSDVIHVNMPLQSFRHLCQGWFFQLSLHNFHMWKG